MVHECRRCQNHGESSLLLFEGGAFRTGRRRPALDDIEMTSKWGVTAIEGH